MWKSLLNMGKFISKIGKGLAESLGYLYPLQDNINVTEYIGRIKELPADAVEFNNG